MVGDESYRIQSSWSRWSWSVMRVVEYSHHGGGACTWSVWSYKYESCVIYNIVTAPLVVPVSVRVCPSTS